MQALTPVGACFFWRAAFRHLLRLPRKRRAKGRLKHRSARRAPPPAALRSSRSAEKPVYKHSLWWVLVFLYLAPLDRRAVQKSLSGEEGSKRGFPRRGSCQTPIPPARRMTDEASTRVCRAAYTSSAPVCELGHLPLQGKALASFFRQPADRITRLACLRGARGYARCEKPPASRADDDFCCHTAPAFAIMSLPAQAGNAGKKPKRMIPKKHK